MPMCWLYHTVRTIMIWIALKRINLHLHQVFRKPRGNPITYFGKCLVPIIKYLALVSVTIKIYIGFKYILNSD